MNDWGLKGHHVDAIRGSDTADWTLGCVRSGKSGQPTSRAMALFSLVGPRLTLLALWHSWHPCEPKQTPPTHLHHWFIIVVRLGVIPSAFAWVIASSGTWRSLELWFSCYSWWLPSPRWLGAAEEPWHEFMIVSGHLPVICAGSWPSPGEEPKGTLVNCSCYWVTLTCG